MIECSPYKISSIFRVTFEIKLMKQNLTTMANMSLVETKLQTNREKYAYVYAFLIISTTVLIFQRAVTLYILCLRASRKIHKRLLQAVIGAHMKFFYTNSSGRIINRFSKDLYDVDYYLALVLYDVTLVAVN